MVEKVIFKSYIVIEGTELYQSLWETVKVQDLSQFYR